MTKSRRSQSIPTKTGKGAKDKRKSNSSTRLRNNSRSETSNTETDESSTRKAVTSETTRPARQAQGRQLSTKTRRKVARRPKRPTTPPPSRVSSTSQQQKAVDKRLGTKRSTGSLLLSPPQRSLLRSAPDDGSRYFQRSSSPLVEPLQPTPVLYRNWSPLVDDDNSDVLSSFDCVSRTDQPAFSRKPPCTGFSTPSCGFADSSLASKMWPTSAATTIATEASITNEKRDDDFNTVAYAALPTKTPLRYDRFPAPSFPLSVAAGPKRTPPKPRAVMLRRGVRSPVPCLHRRQSSSSLAPVPLPLLMNRSSTSSFLQPFAGMTGVLSEVLGIPKDQDQKPDRHLNFQI